MPPRQPESRFWFSLSAVTILLVLGGVTGVMLGLSLAIWLTEGEEALWREIASSGPGRMTLAKLLGIATGAALGVWGAVGVWAGLLGRLGWTEEEIWGPPEMWDRFYNSIQVRGLKFWLAAALNGGMALGFVLGGLLFGIAVCNGLGSMGLLPERLACPVDSWPRVAAGVVGTIAGGLVAIWAWMKLSLKLGFRKEDSGSSPPSGDRGGSGG